MCFRKEKSWVELCFMEIPVVSERFTFAAEDRTAKY